MAPRDFRGGRALMLVGLLIAVPAGVARAQPAPPEMVLMPRQLVDLAREFIRHPQLEGAVDLWLALTACESAQETPPRGDGCPAVTQALAAREAAEKQRIEAAVKAAAAGEQGK